MNADSVMIEATGMLSHSSTEAVQSSEVFTDVPDGPRTPSLGTPDVLIGAFNQRWINSASIHHLSTSIKTLSKSTHSPSHTNSRLTVGTHIAERGAKLLTRSHTFILTTDREQLPTRQGCRPGQRPSTKAVCFLLLRDSGCYYPRCRTPSWS